jgi:hypothetical protein
MHGWKPAELDGYDRRYYQRWSHELPPLARRERGTELDVHHTILAPLSRLRADPAAFWRSAATLGDGSRALCPTHMALHVAVHLFQEGEIAAGSAASSISASCAGISGEVPIFGSNWCLTPSSSDSSDRFITHCIMLPSCSGRPCRTRSWPRRAGSAGRPRRCALRWTRWCAARCFPNLPNTGHHGGGFRARASTSGRTGCACHPLPLASHPLRKAWGRRFAAVS